MLHLEPVATHVLDKPLSGDEALTPDGRHLVFVSKARRRLWHVTLNPARFTIEAIDTGVRLPPAPEKAGTSPRFVEALTDEGTLVALRDHDAPDCVLHALPSGAVRTRVRWSYASAFSPNGLWWIRMRRPFNDDDPWVHIQDTTTGEEHDVTGRWLDAHGQVWMDTRNFAEERHLTPEERARHIVKHDRDDEFYEDILAGQIEIEQRKQADIAARWATPEPLFIDSPDSILTRPAEDGRFEVFVGCYGFVWRCLVEPTPDGLLRRIFSPGSDLVFSDVVYDPVYLLAPGGTHYVLAWHGYGSGLLAMDTRRRVSHAFPVRDVLEKHGYGCITTAVAGVDTAACAVQTREGCFLWRPGEVPAALPASVYAPVALWDGVLLARDLRGRTLTWYRWRLDA